MIYSLLPDACHSVAGSVRQRPTNDATDRAEDNRVASDTLSESLSEMLSKTSQRPS
jgi:hypothetical protein